MNAYVCFFLKVFHDFLFERDIGILYLTKQGRDMNSVGKIKEIITRQGISQKELAARIGMQESGMSKLLSGRTNNPRSVTLKTIADALGVDVRELLDVGGSLPETDDFQRDYVQVPHCDAAEFDGTQKFMGFLCFRRDWLQEKHLDVDKLAVITAKGDSMLPTIKPGAVLLIDLRMQAALHDGLYVMSYGGQLHCKRILVEPERIQVKSDNPAYGFFYCERHEVKIIGRVVWAGQEY
ncbi:MAG: helix-turn-helix transcriptional regulator [Deltaproteobacteria bacterium]|nr:helix-turn-helix transcriptional regulator [Deltaproteobacteria bacterium]